MQDFMSGDSLSDPAFAAKVESRLQVLERQVAELQAARRVPVEDGGVQLNDQAHSSKFQILTSENNTADIFVNRQQFVITMEDNITGEDLEYTCDTIRVSQSSPDANYPQDTGLCVSWLCLNSEPEMIDVNKDNFEKFLLFLRKTCVLISKTKRTKLEEIYQTHNGSKTTPRFQINTTIENRCVVGVDKGKIVVWKLDAQNKFVECYRGDNFEIQEKNSENLLIWFDTECRQQKVSVSENLYDDFKLFLKKMEDAGWLCANQVLNPNKYFTPDKFKKMYPDVSPHVTRLNCTINPRNQK